MTKWLPLCDWTVAPQMLEMLIAMSNSTDQSDNVVLPSLVTVTWP